MAEKTTIPSTFYYNLVLATGVLPLTLEKKHTKFKLRGYRKL